MSKNYPYIHRDLSWLSFNYRLLQEASDKTVPLYERIKFLAIYSANLDEFFRVRVANLKNLIKVGKKTQKILDFEPKELLNEVLSTVNAQQEEFSYILESLITPELKSHDIRILRMKDLKKNQIDFVEDYFNENLIPYVQPLVLMEKKIRPFLNNGALYLVLQLSDEEKPKGEERYGIVKVPSEFQKRFIILPSDKKDRNNIILLDDVIRHCQRFIFPGFTIIDSFSIKLTRDAELYIDDEFEGDLVAKIKKNLTKRNVGPASRLVYDREMPVDVLEVLKDVFELDNFDVLPEGRYHNNSDFFKFPNFGLESLSEKSLAPLQIEELNNGRIFANMQEKDFLLHVPFHSYKPVVNFFEQAAIDPYVTHIKIIQYRVAKKSKIMNALIKAVENGKQVTAFIEIKARFDEAANLEWGEKLEAGGVKVFYSMPGLKVHSKMALIKRCVQGVDEHYAYFSTGNFHEGTAKVYSDLGLFTSNKKLLKECIAIFNYLETKKRPKKAFEHLAVGTFSLKKKLINLVKQEMKNADKGIESSIVLKMNSLEDSEMINLLYDANRKGVKITLIIRGICCIVPGIPGVSDNITAFGVIDRFLEHSRVFIFSNGGDEKIFLSSADWMVRNLHHRIETMIPIFDKKIKKQIKDIIQIQIDDNVKSRRIHYKKNNNYRKSGSDIPVRSQMDTYYYLKKAIEKQNSGQ